MVDHPQSWLLRWAGVLKRLPAALFALALPLAAQQPSVQSAPAPLQEPMQAPLAPPPPPFWQQGRPESMRNSPLVPNPPALNAKPASEIKLDKFKLPPGFNIELWAPGVRNARALALGAKGTVFVGTQFVGEVHAVVEKDGKREVKTILKGLQRPNGVAFHNGALYVAEQSRILRYDNIEDNLDNPGKPAIVFDALPRDEVHGAKVLAVGPDGWLYLNIGAPCNSCVPPETHAQIVRVDPKSSVMETVARGVRNSLGLAFHPVTKDLWFTQNARDWMGDDLPGDTLHRVIRKGLHFGYPYCHQGDTPDPELGRGRACGEFAPPAVVLGPHVAPMGLRFYDGKLFPPEYRNRIIIANHGSWNRANKLGFNLMQVTLDAQGKVVRYELFAEGWAEGNSYWGRPVDVMVMRDGALLVSDDVAGALFRISYRKP